MRAGPGADPFECGQVAVGQIHHMDIVAHAGTIARWVIVSEDRKRCPSAHGHLADIRQQIVRMAFRVFADQAAFMRPHGIEITQHRDGPTRIGRT